VGSEAAEKGGFKVGDRVVVDPVQSNPNSEWSKRNLSNLCDEKRVKGVSEDGGMAEYCVSSYHWIVKIPEGVSYEQAASTEPLACAVYAMNNLNIEQGQFVVVFGPGPIGLMMVQLAKARGASKVMLVGTRDYRLEIGKNLGVDIIANVKDENSPHYVKDLGEAIKAANNGNLADRAVTSTSSVDAIQQAIEITGKHATVVIFGLPGDKDVIQVPALQTILMDKTLRFSWLAPGTWPEALDSIATGKVKVDPIQTHTFSLDQTVEGIQNSRGRVDNCIKALIKVSDN
jgi:threonine dehydrogenase-like Zn-dependent dehydrogenase